MSDQIVEYFNFETDAEIAALIANTDENTTVVIVNACDENSTCILHWVMKTF